MAFGSLRGTLTGSSTNPGTGISATGSVSVSVGDLIIVNYGWRGTSIVTWTDNLGNEYFPLVNNTTGSPNAVIWAGYAYVANAGTLTSITAAHASSSADVGFSAIVIEGAFDISPLDIELDSIADSTTPYGCPASGTLSQADEVIVGFQAQGNGGAAASYTATSPYTLGVGASSGTGANTASSCIIFHLVSSTSTETPEINSSASTSGQTKTASFRKARTKTTGDCIGTFFNGGTAQSPSINKGPPVSVAVGDIIVLVYENAGGGNFTSATDNLSNSYTQLTGGSVSSFTFTAAWSIVTNAGTLSSVDLTTSSSAGYTAIAAVYKGEATAVDKQIASNADTTAPFVGPATGTLAQADELVVAWLGLATSGNITGVTSPSDYSARVSVSGQQCVGLQGRTVSSTASVTDMTFTSGGGSSQVGVVTFKITVAAAAPFVGQHTELPRQQPPPARTWTHSFPLMLMGQDAMTVGEQSTALAPLGARPPYDNDLRTWHLLWYNLNLIGQDAMIVGEQKWDTPAQKPPDLTLRNWYQYFQKPEAAPFVGVVDELPPRDARAVRSWSWNYNQFYDASVPVIGKHTELPERAFQFNRSFELYYAFQAAETPEISQVSDLPPRDPRAVRTWHWNYNQFYEASVPVIGKDAELPKRAFQFNRSSELYYAFQAAETPEVSQVTDLPPRDARAVRAWSWFYQFNAAEAPEFSQVSDLPPRDGRAVRSWSWNYNQFYDASVPFPGKQYDLPKRAAQPDRAWYQWYNLNLIGQDALPVGERWDQTPAQRLPDLTLRNWYAFYEFVFAETPFVGRHTDLPPRDPRAVRSWYWSYNLNLIGQDNIPAGDQEWKLPPLGARVAYDNDLRSWAVNINLTPVGTAATPFGTRAAELPPRGPAPLVKSWAVNYTIGITTSMMLPFNWGVTPRARTVPPEMRTWIFNPIQLNSTIRFPLNYTWGVPKGRQPLSQALIQSSNIGLLAQTFMATAYNWGVARGHKPLLQTWTLPSNFGLLNQTFMATAYNWGVPKSPIQPLRAWSNTFFLGSISLPVGKQYYDRVDGSKRPPEARSWYWWYNLNLIGRDNIPAGDQSYDTVLGSKRAYPIEVRTWARGIYPALIPPPERPPFLQNDWPAPLGHMRKIPVSLRSWINKGIIEIAGTAEIFVDFFENQSEFFSVSVSFEPRYDYPIGRDLDSDYGIRRSRLRRSRLIIGRR